METIPNTNTTTIPNTNTTTITTVFAIQAKKKKKRSKAPKDKKKTAYNPENLNDSNSTVINTSNDEAVSQGKGSKDKGSKDKGSKDKVSKDKVSKDNGLEEDDSIQVLSDSG